MAKSYFKEKNVSYEEFNVAQDFEKQKEMITLTGQRGVPVIVIDGEATVGFNKPRIQELLGL
jgi:alkyl hydroperoxide reductase subunit F